MQFVKMHGIGNDYVFVNCFREKVPARPGALAVEIAKPHTGVGSDGLILMLPDPAADARMRIFNKDGSEGEMCGNGIRCVGKYLYDSGIVKKEKMRIATGGGVRELEIIAEGGIATGARVDMGVPVFDPVRVPVNAGDFRVPIVFPDGQRAMFTCLNIGNPHAVTLSRFPEGDAFMRDGAFVETHPLFPKRVNASFCRADDTAHLTAHIWERGSGATLACGSGACATLVSAAYERACARKATVRLPGGELFIEWDEKTDRVYMTGPATVSFSGVWNE